MIRYKRFLIVLAALVIVGCQASPTTKTAAPETATVKRGTLTQTVSASGTIKARPQVDLTFQSLGQIKRLDVQVGDRVQAGQVLARLDTTDLELAVAQAQVSLDSAKTKLKQTQNGATADELASAKASLSSAYSVYQAALSKYNLTEAQITKARASVDKAAAALDRAKKAYDWHAHDWLDPQPEKSQQKDDLDDAQSAYDLALAAYNQSAAEINDGDLQSAAAKVAQAQYNLDKLQREPTAEDLAIKQGEVEQAEAGLAQAQAQLDDALLIAPFDGTVADVSVQTGQRVNANTRVIVLANLSQLTVKVDLAEADLPSARVGQPVQITLDAVPGTIYTGTVDVLDLVGTTTQGVVNYAATILIGDGSTARPSSPRSELKVADAALRPGMNATASIITQQRDKVLLIPNRAIKTSGEQRLATVQREGKEVDVPITLGLGNDVETELVSGLNEGDVVIVETNHRS
jgi:HlyD family secretion protein